MRCWIWVLIEVATADGLLKLVGEPDWVSRTMNRTSPSASSTVEAISQFRAFRDEVAAACTSPAAHCCATFRLCLPPMRAAGKPRIRLNSTPQTAAVIHHAL